MIDFPASPTTGQLFTASGTTWRYDGEKWNLAFTAASSIVVCSDMPPNSPSAGTLWWDSVGAQLYVWYVDPNSAEWVPTSNSGGIGDAPTDGQTYGRSLTAWTPIPTLASLGGNVGRNLIHNSMFNIQQRGGGPWTTNFAYTADRWMMVVNVDTVSVTAVTLNDTDRAQIGDESARYALQIVFSGSSTAGAYNQIRHMIEGVARLSNKTVTQSIYARSAGGTTPRIGFTLYQTFGTGGSPSAGVGLYIGTSQPITNTWQRVSFSATLPSVAGKTFGTNANSDTTGLFLTLSDQNNQTGTGVGVQSGTILLWGAQLELGSQATPLEHPDPQQDLAKCQRYYQLGAIIGYDNRAANAPIQHYISLLVQMRGIPAYTITGNANVNVTNSALNAVGAVGVYLSANCVSAGDYQININFSASADF